MLTTPVQRILGTRTRGTRLSSSPSKIPYGEFSPVWLQTGIPRRPSPTRSGSSRHPAPAYYTRLKSLSRKRATSRSGTFVQTALSPSDRTLPSRGPWLASGFCCPAGWTLTMTSSETLGSPGATYCFAVRSSLGREVPQFTLPVSFFRAVFRTPVDRTIALGCSFIVRFGLPHLCRGSASTSHALRFQRGPVTRLQSSLYATARKNRWPCTGQGVYVRAFTSKSRLTKASNITTRVNQPIPAAGLAPARQAALWAANRDHRDNAQRPRRDPQDVLCVLCSQMVRGHR